MRLAPRAGLEPATNGLTVRRSTTELPGNVGRWNRRRAILRNGARGVKEASEIRLNAQVEGSDCLDYTLPASGYGLPPVPAMALRRLTPTTMRSTRQVLIARWRAAMAGVMPRRATIVHTCSAYSEGGGAGVA